MNIDKLKIEKIAIDGVIDTLYRNESITSETTISEICEIINNELYRNSNLFYNNNLLIIRAEYGVVSNKHLSIKIKVKDIICSLCVDNDIIIGIIISRRRSDKLKYILGN